MWDLRTQTAMAFYDLYATDRGLDVARETLRLLHDIANTAESMYRVGEGARPTCFARNVEIAKMAEDTLRMQAMREIDGRETQRACSIATRQIELGDAGAARIPRLDSRPRARLDSIAFGERPMIRAGLDDVSAADASASSRARRSSPISRSVCSTASAMRHRGGDDGRRPSAWGV